MSDVEEVVRTLLRIRVARDRVVVRLVDVCLDTARQHLVRIGLVRDVVDDLVARRVEYRVQRNDRLDRTEVRTEMSAVNARAPEHRIAHLLRERLAFCRAVALDVGR